MAHSIKVYSCSDGSTLFVREDGMHATVDAPLIPQGCQVDQYMAIFLNNWAKLDANIRTLRDEEPPHKAPPAALGVNVLRYSPPGSVVLTQAQRDDILQVIEDRSSIRRTR